MKEFALAFTVALILLLGGSVTGYAQHEHHGNTSMDRHKSTHEQADTSGPGHSQSKTDTVASTHSVDPKVAASIKGIVDHYLQMKNAFVGDNTKDAAAAGKEMKDAIGKVDTSLLTNDQKKIFADIEDDATEHAEHIGENSGNIAHQREHFDFLSKDVYDLVKTFGGGQTLYKDFCPMYNDKKGAIWLSEAKAIKNPYFGKKMSTCGSVQEELK